MKAKSTLTCCWQPPLSLCSKKKMCLATLAQDLHAHKEYCDLRQRSDLQPLVGYLWWLVSHNLHKLQQISFSWNLSCVRADSKSKKHTRQAAATTDSHLKFRSKKSDRHVSYWIGVWSDGTASITSAPVSTAMAGSLRPTWIIALLFIRSNRLMRLNRKRSNSRT